MKPLRKIIAPLTYTVLLALTAFFMACSSSRKENAPNPGSNDILDLLTGFGESISKRDFKQAVGYLTPSERSMILDANGEVPPGKQDALASLRLARLIRMPSVHVEGGYLAGIYEILPLDASGQAVANEAPPMENEFSGDDAAGAYGQVANPEGNGTEAVAMTEPDLEAQEAAKDKEELNQAVNQFFKAVSQKNWNAALAMVNENERKILVDDKGKLKEDSKSRLQHLDTDGKEALTLQDGKLTGITLLLPAE